MLDMANKTHIHKNDWHRTVFIDAGGVRTTEFDLSDGKVAMLIENGRKGMTEFLKWFNDPNAEEKPLNRV
jgi:NTE family protein